MDLDKIVNTYNYQHANLNQPTKDVLLQNCNTMLQPEQSYLDSVFNQKTPYNYPSLIICDDSKRNSFNDKTYLFYMDIINDDTGNRFNIRNQKNASDLQAGYARNIDLESELHRINYYQDRCYYDNYKINPNSNLPFDNGLKRNASVIVKDYSTVGQNKDCIGNCQPSQQCYNTTPTDINCENNIRNRYNFNNNKFISGNTCFMKGDRKYFEKVETPHANNLVLQTTPRNNIVIQALNNNETKHDYYKFGDDTGSRCARFPPQRLFYNSTKRSTLPNLHNLIDIGPEFLM